MRKINFVNDEYYHIYNRGVDKRSIVNNQQELTRFFQSMKEFNCVESIGSIYENRFCKLNQLGRPTSKLVEFVAFNILPNHYHFILKQNVDGGISEFMKRMGGYTKYFNDKHKRSGVLFQGKFKSKHIDSNEYLLHLSAYVNLNNVVHGLGRPTSKLFKSSWEEYLNKNEKGFCCKDIILDQFKDVKDYKHFAEDSLKDIIDRKYRMKDLIIEDLE